MGSLNLPGHVGCQHRIQGEPWSSQDLCVGERAARQPENARVREQAHARLAGLPTAEAAGGKRRNEWHVLRIMRSAELGQPFVWG